MIRSLLFVPADQPRRIAKALALPADAVLLDLEDAVAPSAKLPAREALRDILVQPRHALALVRINAFDTAWCFGDLAASVAAGLDGIMLPKLETPAQLVALDWAMSALEAEAGLPRLDLLPIIETARGHVALRELAQAAATLGGRVRRLAFGGADYTLDLNLTWTPGEAELAPLRADMVLASRAAGLEAPIDTVWTAIRDTAGFAASCMQSSARGFQGRLCLHPDQLGPANAAYSPSPKAIAAAERILAGFTGAAVMIDGRMVDAPIADRARRLLAGR